jgi:1,4-alpha-glucan branching enzyme
MAQIVVTFTFHSGVKRHLFQNIRLSGSWDANGMFSNQWAQVQMAAAQDETGCDAFTASVSLDASQVGSTFQWGVIADLAGAQNSWVVVTEVPDPNSTQQTRSFVLTAAGGPQD